ncbi:hypothetical protein AC629_00420 [Bradyrhizobium sp. NAS80.1]|uniref:hypothetical protein n=1 Tax=Bradyrhizobium sp. NAS80.1 TaxID=1680159 RepID=UPI0009598CA0|nr:hypothetical protein [Bradyrhizobium sp. NAS80.1]OKO92399.1 hypothetical protein AC629_00420 [Bradyrhizobium sp. NAS80.1]
MPADALPVTIVVVAVFVGFAGALAWADRQTSAGRLDRDSKREAPEAAAPSDGLIAGQLLTIR